MHACIHGVCVYVQRIVRIVLYSFFSLSDCGKILIYSDPSIRFYGMRVGVGLSKII